MQEQKKDNFERITGRPAQPSTQQQQATMTLQPQNNFERITGRATQSLLDKKIEIPDKAKSTVAHGVDAYTVAKEMI